MGAWLLDHFSGKRWLAQQQWAARERYYVELLGHLTKAEMSLQAQSEYYAAPGSEDYDYSKDERFTELGRTAGKVLHAVEELAGTAALFLSQKAIDALQELVREDWHASFDTTPDEYLNKALPFVRTAKAAVLAAAKAELAPT